MRIFWLWIRSMVFNWVGGMSTAFGLCWSILGWFVIPDNSQLRPFIKGVGVPALVWAAYRAWATEHKNLEVERAKNGRPQLTGGIMVAGGHDVEEDNYPSTKPTPAKRCRVQIRAWVRNQGHVETRGRIGNVSLLNKQGTEQGSLQIWPVLSSHTSVCLAGFPRTYTSVPLREKSA
jgi:hypothetical protein